MCAGSSKCGAGVRRAGGRCGGDDEQAASGKGGTTKVKVGNCRSPTPRRSIAHDRATSRRRGSRLSPQVGQGGAELVTSLVAGDSQFAFLGSAGDRGARQGAPDQGDRQCRNGAKTPDKEWQIIMSAKTPTSAGRRTSRARRSRLNALRGVGEVTVKAAMEAEGADPNSVKFIEIPFPEMPAALEKGRVDAIWAPEPFLTQVLGSGGHDVLPVYQSLAPLFPNGAYATTDKYIAKNKQVVEGFARAINKGLKYASDNPEAARKTITTFTKIPPDVAQKMRLPLWPTAIDQAQLTDLIGYTQKYGVIEKPSRSRR